MRKARKYSLIGVLIPIFLYFSFTIYSARNLKEEFSGSMGIPAALLYFYLYITIPIFVILLAVSYTIGRLIGLKKDGATINNEIKKLIIIITILFCLSLLFVLASFKTAS